MREKRHRVAREGYHCDACTGSRASERIRVGENEERTVHVQGPNRVLKTYRHTAHMYRHRYLLSLSSQRGRTISISFFSFLSLISAMCHEEHGNGNAKRSSHEGKTFVKLMISVSASGRRVSPVPEAIIV